MYRVKQLCLRGGGENLKLLKGFTLAEVLITLGIIGVVAAMTMSNIISKHETKKLISQLATANTMLEQGFSLAITDLGEVDGWADKDNRLDFIYKEVIPRYFKVVKDCGNNGASTCNLKDYKNTDGSSTWGFKNFYSFVLANGMTIFFWPSSSGSGCSAPIKHSYTYYPGYGYCAELYVDVNGNKGPNIAGKDMFAFSLWKDGIIPSGGAQEPVWTMTFEDQCLTAKRSVYCTAWVLYNKNMDYLKCNDLSWKGKRSCDE